MVTLPNALTNGTTADGSEVFENDAALRDALDQIKDANIVSGAGIASSKLAAKFAVQEILIPLVPVTSDTSLDTPAEFGLPQSMTTIFKHKISLRSGQAAALCLVEWHLMNLTVASTTYPQVDLLVNSVQVGGEVKQLTAEDAYYQVAYSNPIDAPLLPLNDGDILEWRVGKSSSGATTVAGLMARLVVKRELVP